MEFNVCMIALLGLGGVICHRNLLARVIFYEVQSLQKCLFQLGGGKFFSEGKLVWLGSKFLRNSKLAIIA